VIGSWPKRCRGHESRKPVGREARQIRTVLQIDATAMHCLPRSYTTELGIVGCRVTRVKSPGSFDERHLLLITDDGAHRIDWNGRGTFEISRLDNPPQDENHERIVGLPGVVTGVWAAALDAYQDHWLVCELDIQYGIVFGSFCVCGPPHFVLDFDVRSLDVLRPKDESLIDESYRIRECDPGRSG